MSQETDVTPQNVLTEKDICELLGMNKDQVANLRTQKGLPFIKVNDRNRLYFENDVIDFFRQQRLILNRDETES